MKNLKLPFYAVHGLETLKKHTIFCLYIFFLLSPNISLAKKKGIKMVLIELYTEPRELQLLINELSNSNHKEDIKFT
jgi:hypothetical protein